MAANTLTGNIPIIYEALYTVARELVGAIPVVKKNATAERVGLNQTVRVPIAGTTSLVSVSPGAYAPDAGEQVSTYADVLIDKSYVYPIKYTGEEQLGLGANYQDFMRQQFTQGFRALCNQVETDILTNYKYASRAWGTAGTTPFASDLEAAAQIKKILDDNGAPDDGNRALIVDTTAGVKLRGLSNLVASYAAGTDATLRNGALLDVFGFKFRESAGVQYHTKGTGTGYDFIAAGEAIGQTTLSMEGGNSGTILAGDVVTLSATDTNKYVVTSGGTATGAASGTIEIGAPGLLIAKVDADEMTIGNSYRANLAFHRDALVLAARAPAMPEGGDAADDVMMIQDPVSGLVFQVAMYRQYRQVKFEIGLAWGTKMVNPQFAALLLG